MNRASATQQDKHVIFKTAYQNITHYREQKNFIAAYIIAFSLIEDRVRAMFVVRHSTATGTKPTISKINGSFANHVRQLSKSSDISSEDSSRLLEEAKQRNELLHAAMWNLNAFTEGSVDRVTKLSRVVDACLRKQKKEVDS